MDRFPLLLSGPGISPNYTKSLFSSTLYSKMDLHLLLHLRLFLGVYLHLISVSPASLFPCILNALCCSVSVPLSLHLSGLLPNLLACKPHPLQSALSPPPTPHHSVSPASLFCATLLCQGTKCAVPGRGGGSSGACGKGQGWRCQGRICGGDVHCLSS